MIRIQQQREGFSLSFKGRKLFSHCRRKPALSVGRGEGRYSSVRGHFRIKDEVRQRICCRDFQVLEESAGRAVVAFSDLLRLEFTEEHGRLICRVVGLDPAYNRLWLELHAEADEAVYGCGEQYSRLNLRGSKLPIWSQEQGVGRGLDPITLLAQMNSGSGGHWYSSYFPMALFLSSRNWYCYCDNPGCSEFDFRDKGRHRLKFWQIPERLVFDVGESAPELIDGLTDFLGRQPLLPEWTQEGMWLGVQGGPDVIRGKLDRALQAGVNVAALWVQDWTGRRLTSFGSQLMWNWRYDAERYPDLPRLIEELHGRGIRFLGYINPFLAVERDLYREASAKGFCVKDVSGADLMVTITDFPAAMIDLTNPAARKWIKGVIRENMLGIGLDGWMADYGEYLPPGAVLHSGESWEQVHNSYPVLWAQVNREAVAEAGREREAVFFMRAGYHGSTRSSPAFWAGDQLVSWSLNDGLATVIPAGISLGLQGAAHFHYDLGGFTTVAWVRRSKELFLRWAELSAFSLQMRSHEGNRPERNWQFDSDSQTLEFLARMTRIFDGLKAYRVRALQEYQANGLPPIRHPYLHYEGDLRLHKLQYQYLLGRDLLVAPVISPRRRSRHVYLPADSWIHLWSGKRCAPGWQRVPAPLGQPPVFYRESSAFAKDFAALGQLKKKQEWKIHQERCMRNMRNMRSARSAQSKERVLKAFAFEQPDATPSDYYATPEIHTALLKHFKVRDDNELRNCLGTDIRFVNPPYTGPELPVYEDGSKMNIWGIRKKPTANEYGDYEEAVNAPYAEWKIVEEAESFDWPNPDWYDYSAVPAICDRYPGKALLTGAFAVQDFINGAAFGRGVEQTLVDIALEDPVFLYITERRHRFYMELIERTLKAAGGKLDLVLCGDDFGAQRGLMISPASFDRLFEEKKKEFFDMVHSYGAKVTHHCCGSSRELIPRFIELDMDALQTIQPQAYGMDPYELKREFHGQIVLHGAVDVQGWLQRATSREIQEEIDHLVEEVGKDGGFIIAPCHQIQPDTPLENVLALYRALAEGRAEKAHPLLTV